MEPIYSSRRATEWRWQDGPAPEPLDP